MTFTAGDIVVIGLPKRWALARFDRVEDDSDFIVTCYKTDSDGKLIEQSNVIRNYKLNSFIDSLGIL